MKVKCVTKQRYSEVLQCHWDDLACKSCPEARKNVCNTFQVIMKCWNILQECYLSKQSAKFDHTNLWHKKKEHQKSLLLAIKLPTLRRQNKIRGNKSSLVINSTVILFPAKIIATLMPGFPRNNSSISNQPVNSWQNLKNKLMWGLMLSQTMRGEGITKT